MKNRKKEQMWDKYKPESWVWSVALIDAVLVTVGMAFIAILICEFVVLFGVDWEPAVFFVVVRHLLAVVFFTSFVIHLLKRKKEKQEDYNQRIISNFNLILKGDLKKQVKQIINDWVGKKTIFRKQLMILVQYVGFLSNMSEALEVSPGHLNSLMNRLILDTEEELFKSVHLNPPLLSITISPDRTISVCVEGKEAFGLAKK